MSENGDEVFDDPQEASSLETDELECSYLVPQVNLAECSARVIDGDKVGSKWLVVGDMYIFHKNDSSLDGENIYWECSKRKQTR